MNHLGDTNKMVSETPRTDRVLKNCNGWHHVPIEMARELERELNAANDRIKRLEEMYEGVIGERPEFLGSNVMGLLKRELAGTQKRIKRLEEAGDILSRYLRDMPYASDYLYQSGERSLRINNWTQAKEAKP